MSDHKIHQDEIDWLIVQACSCEVPEIKDEAYQKLEGLGLNQEQIEKKYAEISPNEFPEEIFNKAYKKQEERNAQESYSLREKIYIFLLGPLNLFPNFINSLLELFTYNYRTKKYKQRLILLISGIIFWVLIGIIGFQWSEYQWQKKVDNADIHEWENNRIKKKHRA
jgi:hypothetical protein